MSELYYSERYYSAQVVIEIQTKHRYDQETHTVTFYLKHDGELTINQLLSQIRRNHRYNRAKSIDIKRINEISAEEFNMAAN